MAFWSKPPVLFATAEYLAGQLGAVHLPGRQLVPQRRPGEDPADGPARFTNAWNAPARD
jgi:hypothetical protein